MAKSSLGAEALSEVVLTKRLVQFGRNTRIFFIQKTAELALGLLCERRLDGGGSGLQSGRGGKNIGPEGKMLSRTGEDSQFIRKRLRRKREGGEVRESERPIKDRRREIGVANKGEHRG